MLHMIFVHKFNINWAQNLYMFQVNGKKSKFYEINSQWNFFHLDDSMRLELTSRVAFFFDIALVIIGRHRQTPPPICLRRRHHRPACCETAAERTEARPLLRGKLLCDHRPPPRSLSPACCERYARPTAASGRPTCRLLRLLFSGILTLSSCSSLTSLWPGASHE